MTAKNGLPCKKCGTSEWNSWSNCKQCSRDRSRLHRETYPERRRDGRRKWYEANRDREIEYARKWREVNPERCRENDRKWYEANRERKRFTRRKWKEANPGKHRESSRKWRERNPEGARESLRRWYVANAEKHKESSRVWARANPGKAATYRHRRRTRIKGSGGSYTEQEWNALCKQYNNQCLACGRSDLPLTADHVVPVVMGGSSYISNIQPLCLPCNSRKRARIIDYRNKPIARRWVQPSLFVAAVENVA